MSEKAYLVREAKIYNKTVNNSASLIPIEIFAKLDDNTSAVNCNLEGQACILEVPNSEIYFKLNEALVALQKLLNTKLDENISI